MADLSSIFKRGQGNKISTTSNPFKDPNEVLKFAIYQYKRNSLPFSLKTGELGALYTVTDATTEVVEGIHPLLCSESYTYSSKHTTVAQQPLASEEYGFASLRITATAINGTARRTINTLQFETDGLNYLRFVVAGSATSSTGKFRLYTDASNYREFTYTTSATAGAFTQITIDPFSGGTDTGTVNMDSITQVGWVVDTSGHYHDVFCLEAAENPIQFTSTVVDIDMSHCVNEFSYNDEIDKIDLMCGNSIKATEVNGRRISFEITSANQNSMVDAISNSQTQKVQTEIDVQRLTDLQFDGSGNLDLTGYITSAVELVKSATQDGTMLTITEGTQTGTVSNLVLNPSTLILSGGVLQANKKIDLKRNVQVKTVTYEKRQTMGYYGEFYMKKKYKNGGYRVERFEQASITPTTYEFNTDGEDSSKYMIDIYENRSAESGIPIYGTTSYMS